jgi:hypothetical protein
MFGSNGSNAPGLSVLPRKGGVVMKRKLILATLALIMTSGVCSAFTREQGDVIAVAALAQWSGLDDHCPRFKLMNDEMIAELAATGLTQRDFDGKEMLAERDRAMFPVIASYRANPSNFCNAAWVRLGPNGTYKRQMLESK